MWTSNAHEADWCFVVCRTEPGSERHHGLSFLLVPIDQDGVEVRPIEQLTGGSEFNEVFFTGARTSADLVVGEPGDGWKVAMGLLGFERGVSTLGQQVGFARELEGVVELARENGAFDDPVIRDRLAQAKVELEVMRVNALRGLSAAVAGEGSSSGGGAASIGKLVWANWHRQARRAGDGRGRPGRADRARRAVRPRPVAAALPVLPRRHDLRRQRRDPAQHPRRARARPAEGATRMTTTRAEQPAPEYVPGHDLLAGKVVVVTAAAGAGIGAAVVRRALEEGAKAVVFSDTHERRLAEAEQSLAEEFGADRVRSLVCDVTVEEQVAALLDAADEFGGVDVMVNNAGLGGTAVDHRHDRRRVVAGPRHHPHRHVPLRPRGEQPDDRRRHGRA